METIEREINELENTRDTTYRTCERLAWLLIVRDHLRPTPTDDKTQWISGSEFLDACSGVSYPSLMRILDEHMSALSVVNRREYDAMIAKINALPK